MNLPFLKDSLYTYSVYVNSSTVSPTWHSPLSITETPNIHNYLFVMFSVQAWDRSMRTTEMKMDFSMLHTAEKILLDAK